MKGQAGIHRTADERRIPSFAGMTGGLLKELLIITDFGEACLIFNAETRRTRSHAEEAARRPLLRTADDPVHLRASPRPLRPLR